MHPALCRAQVYALRRLARGLSSGRDAARQGYAAALTGLLAAPDGKQQGGKDRPLLTPEGFMVLLEVCVDGPLKGGVSARRLPTAISASCLAPSLHATTSA